MTKEDRDKELDGINESRIKLGELAGQLGGFVGQSESVKKAVKNALDILTEQQKKCKSCLNQLHNNVVDCQDPSNCQSIKEKIEKLEKQESAIEKGVNNPRDLLTNLCTGLEMFLGFDSSSKGYTGKGIVYSDLDRLCDAVMGFLYEIITEVNNNENLKKYNAELPGILEKIKQAQYNRKEHFETCIHRVTRSLTDWVRGVDEKHESVMKPLYNLSKFIDGHTSVDMEDNSITEQLRNWQGLSSLYLKEAQSAASALENIDDHLHTQIAPRIDTIRTVAQYFWNSVNDPKVTNAINLLDNKLTEIPINVNKHIASELKGVHQRLNVKLNSVEHNIKHIKQEKDSHIQSISAVVSTARGYVSDLLGRNGEAFDQKYKTPIHKMFEDINLKIEALRKEPTRSSQIHTEVNAIREMLLEVGNTLGQHVQSLAERIGHAETLRAAAQEKATKALNIVNDKDADGSGIKHPSKIKEAAGALDKRAKTLKSIYDNAKRTVDDAKASALETLKSLDGLIKKDLGVLKGQLESAIDASIKQIVTKVVGAAKLVSSVNRDYSSLTGGQNALTSGVNTLPEGPLKQWVSGLTDNAAKLLEDVLFAIKYNAGQRQSPLDSVDPAALRLTDAVIKEMQKNISEAMKEYDHDNNLDFKSTVMTNYAGDEGTNGDLHSGTGKNKLKKQLHRIVVSELQVDDENKTKLQLANEKDVDTEITKLHAAITEALTTFNGALEKMLDNKSDIEAGVLQKLAALDVTIGHKNKDHDSLGHVQKQLSELHEHEIEQSGKIQNAISAAIDTITKLERAPETVCTAKEAVSKCLSDLKQHFTTLQTKIENIENNVGPASEAIESAIQTTASAVQQVRDTATFEFALLKTKLQKRVSQTFKEMDNSTQKMYNELRKVEFKSLKDCITSHIPGIENIVDTNANTGPKGLMRKLKAMVTLLYNSETSMHIYASKVKNFYHSFLGDLTRQSDLTDHSPRLTPLAGALSAILSTMHQQKHFSAAVSSRLADLQAALTTLTPTQFAEASPLLNVVKAGVQAFHGELAKQYVNRYAGETFGANLFDTKHVDGKKSESITSYGTKLSKVFLTLLYTLSEKLDTLRTISSTLSKSDKINRSTTLGEFFADNGFIVSYKDKYNGELRDDDGALGFHVSKKLTHKISTAESIEHLQKCKYDDDPEQNETSPFSLLGILDCLYRHILQYNEVGHFVVHPKPRAPCSTFEMLIWLRGLPHNPVYSALQDGINNLLDDSDKQIGDIGGIPLINFQSSYLNAYPSRVTYEHLQQVLENICSKSYDILCTIVGTGDLYTIYGCDFYNNAMKFHYPKSGEDCFHMLVDILRRLFLPLRFIQSQCKLSAEYSGWEQCRYGKDIATPKSLCNSRSTEKPTLQPKCEPNCQPKCESNCQPTSPLMSYLNDCLPGHLPHQLSDIGCKPKCGTCPKSTPGMPCLTPLGFRGFSGKTKTGKELCSVLDRFFSNVYVASLLSLAPKPPSTLPEHFYFALALTKVLNNDKDSNTRAITTAFKDTTNEMSIELYNDTNDFTNALGNAYRSHRLENHKTYSEADLSTLSVSTPCTFASSDKLHCAPYLRSLCDDSYTYLAEKHSKLYFSWALYLPWTLYDYLKSLFESFSNISCNDWGCSRCTHGTKCSRGKHGVENCQCRGLVECRGVSSTFYSYGFTFGDSTKLHGDSSKSYCHHFYIQLKNVLQSTHFAALFKECDNYMWMIRRPFIWLNVALWSLSLFYLICVMVGRLDVLHIRSHLRIPSSHKITAQSLLAAAQVGRLAKISYLQP